MSCCIKIMHHCFASFTESDETELNLYFFPPSCNEQTGIAEEEQQIPFFPL